MGELLQNETADDFKAKQLLTIAGKNTQRQESQQQCCQVYDNYRICTIILPSVRCTINNPKKGQIYDNLTIP